MLIAGVLLFAVAGSTLAQGKVRYAELPNFHLVNSQLYRGAQPKIGGLQTLKTMGIKAIVNLRGKDEQTGAEGQEARALGLRYYNISLPGFSEPKDKEVRQVLDIINNLENQPVFVHCHHVKIAPAQSSPAIALRTTVGQQQRQKKKLRNSG
jgi:protein tyrosine/serine phosphatase